MPHIHTWQSLQLGHHCKSSKACFSVTNMYIRKSPNYLKRREQYCILQGFQSIPHTPSSHNKGGKISVTRKMNTCTYTNGMIKVYRLHKLQSTTFCSPVPKKAQRILQPNTAASNFSQSQLTCTVGPWWSSRWKRCGLFLTALDHKAAFCIS